MKTTQNTLSNTRINRLRVQGYSTESVKELSNMAFGIRFAYRLCATILLIAIATQSIALFSVMLCVAFLGLILPNHPFDYIYNYVLSGWMNKPMIPARSKQLKFACGIATAWLSGVVYLMSTESTTAGLMMAGVLAGMAILPSTIDLCLPSKIYNALFLRKEKVSQTV